MAFSNKWRLRSLLTQENLMRRLSIAERAIVFGQAIMVALLLVGALLFDVYTPAWMWN